MPNEIELFSREKLNFYERFYKLMDLLLSQSNNKNEALFYKSIYYIQLLSLFYSEQIHIFNKRSKSDEIFIYIQKIIRIKDLFRSHHTFLEIFLYIIFCIMILAIIFFVIICMRTFNNSIYSFNKKIIHNLIKIFIFFGFNIILDCCFSNYCFGFEKYNPNFTDGTKCRNNNQIALKVISGIFIIISILLKFLFHIYYSDIFIFSGSYHAKISCHYELYMDIISIFNSILMIQAYSLKREIFLVFNFISSIIMIFYYFTYHYVYYKIDMNNLVGIFHALYTWTSIFGLIFAYINVEEKGIIYFISSIVIGFCFYNFKTKFENDLFYRNSINDLSTVHQALYFINILTKKINHFDECSENKAFVIGLIDVVTSEKSKSKIYKKIKEEKNEELEEKLKIILKGGINEPNIRKYVLETLLNLFVLIFDERADICLNLSLYYLISIRNYCKSMYIYQKALRLKLSILEKFASERLKLEIDKIIKQNLQTFGEQNVSLENIDVSLYFKYDTLSHDFFDQISKEIELSLEFWREYKKYSILRNYKIDYNKIFKLTDKIKTTGENVLKMWEELLKIYNGVNEYFYFYNDYIEQIIDDNLKKKDLDSLKRKNDTMVENINNNYYIILFNKDTGIIIANVDKGSEGIIKHCNKRIMNIFNYKISELKDENITKLMPKLFEKEHSQYIQNYFSKGSNKYVEKQDFKTFGKDKYNSIIQIKLGLKLFPVINQNVFMAAIIIKESMDDMIILDKDFIIQGMSYKLTKIFNLNENSFFQRNQVPFYALCKKFINFYNMFLKNKKTEDIQDLDPGFAVDNNNIKGKDLEIKESPKAKDKEKSKNIEIHENIEVNENIELEFEIKIPQFIIDYAKVSKKLSYQNSFMSDDENEEEENNSGININKNSHQDILDSDTEETHEKTPLIHQEESINAKIIRNVKSKKYSNLSRFKFLETSTPTTHDEVLEDLKERISNEQERMAHQTKEEKIFNEVINEYILLFTEEKYNELEDNIDLYNKNSSFNEYKFNFAFDKAKFGENQILYIVRCIDNQMDEGFVSEGSKGEVNPSSEKYKKEKLESIKPLFEVIKEEQNDIVKSYESFIKLSMENNKFKLLLEAAKKDIDDLSKIHGQKKEEVLEDENSSQTSQAGFDTGLVQKNKIEEVKAKLFNNSNNFTTIKYIRLTMILLALFTIVFSIVYLLQIFVLDKCLRKISEINLYLLQTSLWTTELISSIISLKFFYDIKLGHINVDLNNFDFEPLIDLNIYNKGLGENIEFLYKNLINYLGQIEMEIPEFLSNDDLSSLYWGHINVSFVDDSFIRENMSNNESYPSAMDQFLCNSKRFSIINGSEEYLKEISKDESFESYFNYTSYLVIENGYNSILPEQFKKIKNIPIVLQDYNNKKKIILIVAILIFAICSILALIFFILLIRMTNKAMTRLLKKISKIKNDKIEERIKKLEVFSTNLNKFKEMDYNNITEESKMKSENNADKNASKLLLYNKTFKTENSFSEMNTTKSSTDSSFSTGYNLEEKKYTPLRVLNEYFIHAFIIIIIFAVFIILIYYFSSQAIKDINTLLLIQKFFYGKLISTSIEMVEVKCYISNCANKTAFDLSQFKSYSNINTIVVGLKKFDEINSYYNNKILVNACDAVENEYATQHSFELCINDTYIKRGNNSYNLIKLISDKIINIYIKDKMNSKNVINYERANLFKSEEYLEIEYIYYNYIYGIDKSLSRVIKSNIISYLKYKKEIIISLIFYLILVTILYFFIFMGIYIPRLIHFINVTRSVIKIIPTSIIMITQDLEKWIESKYNNNISF